MTDAQPVSDDHAAHLQATQARQGFRGRHALAILVASTVLVVLVLFGVWAAKSRDLAKAGPDAAQVTSAATNFTAPATPARQDEGSPGGAPAR